MRGHSSVNNPQRGFGRQTCVVSACECTDAAGEETWMATQRERPSAKRGGGDDKPAAPELGGLFKGLGHFIEMLGDLADKGAALERHGSLGEEGKGMKAIYGFTMKVGGEGAPRVESFGNVRPGRKGEAVVEATREPIIDVLEEDGGVRLVAELPGVDEPDISYDIEDDIVTLRAKHGDRRYEKEIELPTKVLREGAQQSFRNGVFELRLKSAGESAGG